MHHYSTGRYGGLVLAVLAVWLGAAPAEAKEPKALAVCRARCARIVKKVQEDLTACRADCPTPTPGNMDAFQACNNSCAKKHRVPGQVSCVSQCESGELDKPAKKGQAKKKSSHPKDDPVTHVRPETN